MPDGSRATQGKSLDRDVVTPGDDRRPERPERASREARGQTLAQMAIAWVLRDGRVTTALIGASRPSQVVDCVGAVGNLDFTEEN